MSVSVCTAAIDYVHLSQSKKLGYTKKKIACVHR